MEILSADRRERWRRRLSLVAALGMATCAVSCVLLHGLVGGPKRFAFGHDVHVRDQGLTCIGCHAEVMRVDAPGMPDPDTCEACHEELDGQKPAEKRVTSLFDGEAFRAAHAAALSPEIVFSHARHAKEIDCAACHRGIDSNGDVEALSPFTMDDCTRCHAQRKVAEDCAACHTQVTRETAPPNHARNWTRAHGMVSRSLSNETNDRCTLCHTESSCLQCHKEEAPANHNLQFRERGHGIQAALDRQNCAACHESDTCDRCHRETTPRSHVGSFGGTISTHCLGCHFPLRGEGCVVCHKETPSHLATPKPDDHTPVMICRQCHGVVAPLPHVDKGDDCNACHP